jgi:hypothetical protein
LPNIIAIVSDERVRTQIDKLVKDFNNADLKVATFKNVKDFEAVYFPPKLAVVEKPAEPAPAPDEKKPAEEMEKPPEAVSVPGVSIPFDKISILLFQIDTIGEEKVPAWAQKMLKRTKEKGYWPEETRTRLILLKYEDDGISKLDVMCPEVDDLIYVPLDRLVFLQKLEVMMALPKKTKGSFLFNQELQQEIEISKITKLSGISDVGIAVRNPLPLQSGIRAKFYVTLPGDKEVTRFFAKSLRSIAHPQYPGEYLCYFSYFGLRKKELSKIRQWLGKIKGYKSILNQDPAKFKLDKNDLFQMESAGTPKNLVIVDHGDPQMITDQVLREIDNVQIYPETSYTDFIYKYVKGTSGGTGRAGSAEDLPGGNSLHLTVGLAPRNLLSMATPPTDEDKWFGNVAKDFLKNGSEDWWRVFKSEQNELLLTEALELLKEGRAAAKVLIAKSATDENVAVKFQLSDLTEAAFKLEISILLPDEHEKWANSTPKLSTLDALIIDTAFVPREFDGWLEFLRTSLTEKGMIKRPEDLKILLISDREDRLERQWLDSPHVIGLLIKPLETRTMLFLLAEAIHAKFSMYRFENIGWAETHTNLHMSKEIQLEAISEFGATLRSASPFRPGSIFFLRKLIFDNAPNQCLAARVYFCEEHPSEKDQFQISTTYYGINDGFLKFARTWIRDMYAASKSKE